VLLSLSKNRRVEAFARNSSLFAGLVRRFVAGETLDDATRVVRSLNSRGMSATLDHLGENTTNPEEAHRAAEWCIRVVETIKCEGLDANLSLKLTQLGLDISTELATQHLLSILAAARIHNQFVRIDMESSAHVDRTLEVFDQVWQEYRNVGLVFQSYLYRSEKDVEEAIRRGVRVRLVKGAYNEPPSVAYRRKSDVDAAFRKLAERLLTEGEYPAIATHDERIINHVKRFCRQQAIGSDRFEFQMLFGIRRDLQESLVREGYRMRIYTPFGTEWYGYTMRRLAERPANMWFVVRNLFRQ